MAAPSRTAPDSTEIAALGEAALAEIPAALRAHLGGVAIQVADFPDAETLAELGLESPFDLLGLYHGVSLPEKSIADTPDAPDIIYLYRRPLLDEWCAGGEDLYTLVRHVLIHEIGHHFGFSDATMEAIDAEDD